MMAAGKKMAELMDEQNAKKSEGEGQARSKGRGVFVKKCESVEKPVERNGLILRISHGKLSAGDQAGAKSEKK